MGKGERKIYLIEKHRNGECQLHGDAAEDAEGADEQSGHPAPGTFYHVFNNHVWNKSLILPLINIYVLCVGA